LRQNRFFKKSRFKVRQATAPGSNSVFFLFELFLVLHELDWPLIRNEERCWGFFNRFFVALKEWVLLSNDLLFNKDRPLRLILWLSDLNFDVLGLHLDHFLLGSDFIDSLGRRLFNDDLSRLKRREPCPRSGLGSRGLGWKRSAVQADDYHHDHNEDDSGDHHH